ncbi:hypothetical protein SEA_NECROPHOXINUS_11 [Microbacterium phage Necrophoxinus]|nr:hypothetical protein SEA_NECROPHOXINUS_11 [Microbacterium phage Necrophoxinus]
MASGLDSLDLKILAHVEGLDEAKKALDNAMKALVAAQADLASVSVTMDVE